MWPVIRCRSTGRSLRPLGLPGELAPGPAVDQGGAGRGADQTAQQLVAGGQQLPPGRQVRLPRSYVQDRELVVTGAFRCANTWPTAIGLAASGRVDLDAMVTGHFGLSEVESALIASRSDPTAIKVMVRPGE
ncbi:MAG TPA: hypothetical protein VI357_08870 [Mycobacteriales bacterium]